MESNARDAYLESQVLTATPQRLRLMLIEGAIRFARQAIAFWEQGQADAGTAALHRARRIVSELLSGIRPESSSLSSKVAGVYSFLFRTFSEALPRRDVRRVAEALEVLEVEHETWRLLCGQLPEHPASGAVATNEARQSKTRSDVPPDFSATTWSDGIPPTSAPGFLMDA
jgi:flagellar protein FliS